MSHNWRPKCPNKSRALVPGYRHRQHLNAAVRDYAEHAARSYLYSAPYRQRLLHKDLMGNVEPNTERNLKESMCLRCLKR